MYVHSVKRKTKVQGTQFLLFFTSMHIHLLYSISTRTMHTYSEECAEWGVRGARMCYLSVGSISVWFIEHTGGSAIHN
jgi:hypothetical protein